MRRLFPELQLGSLNWQCLSLHTDSPVSFPVTVRLRPSLGAICIL